MAIVIGNHHCILAKLIYNSIRQPIMNPYPHIVEDAVATAFARLAGRFTRRGVSECRKSASIIARSA